MHIMAQSALYIYKLSREQRKERMCGLARCAACFFHMLDYLFWLGSRWGLVP